MVTKTLKLIAMSMMVSMAVSAGWMASASLSAVQAVVQTPTYSCNLAVVMDGEPHEWGPVETLVEDDNEIDGTSWYYNSGWSNTPSDSDTYSMVPDEMFDLQAVKLCHSATDFFVEFETYYPPFKLFRIGEDQFYELGDPAGAGDAIGLPEDIDHWLVLKLAQNNLAQNNLAQNNEPNIYYYTIHFTGQPGDTNTFDLLASHALYQESYQESEPGDDLAFNDSKFSPVTDTLLVTFNSFMETDQFDNESGYEASFDLLHADGETDALSYVDFTYGDLLVAQAQTYQSTDVMTLLDETDNFSYELGAVGVGGVKIPQSTRQRTQAAVEWKALPDAGLYRLILKRKSKIVRQVKTTKNRRVFKHLQSATRYKVSITAKVGDAYTPWTNLKQFKTRP